MLQTLMEHNSLKRKTPALAHKATVLKSDKEGDLSEILEVTRAFNISLVMGSFFALGFPRILWDALNMEETIG